ncbi:MAG TPA: Hpt domain-containing protein [Longimicrobiales bacterium]|nr:Hpt domain-containing protein [Longimicrobiales bacterium]
MSRVRAFFLEEASECMRDARAGLDAGDHPRLRSAVRRLRGSAQMARFGEVAEVAGTLEEALGPGGDPDVAGALDRLDDLLGAVRVGELEQDLEPEKPMEGEGRAENGGMVEIEELEYRGRAALERALQLREAIEDAVVAEQPVGPILDELFDLVRQGMR